jgi:hypothetical protein
MKRTHALLALEREQSPSERRWLLLAQAGRTDWGGCVESLLI